jgi:hypothetical protein
MESRKQYLQQSQYYMDRTKIGDNTHVSEEANAGHELVSPEALQLVSRLEVLKNQFKGYKRYKASESDSYRVVDTIMHVVSNPSLSVEESLSNLKEHVESRIKDLVDGYERQRRAVKEVVANRKAHESFASPYSGQYLSLVHKHQLLTDPEYYSHELQQLLDTFFALMDEYSGENVGIKVYCFSMIQFAATYISQEYPQSDIRFQLSERMRTSFLS